MTVGGEPESTVEGCGIIQSGETGRCGREPEGTAAILADGVHRSRPDGGGVIRAMTDHPPRSGPRILAQQSFARSHPEGTAPVHTETPDGTIPGKIDDVREAPRHGGQAVNALAIGADPQCPGGIPVERTQ